MVRGTVFPSCLWWLHSCEGSKRRRAARSGTCECVWVLLLLSVFVFTLVWTYITQILLNDMHNFNEYMFRSQGWWLDWSLVLVTLTAVLLTYCGVLLLLSLCLVLCAHPLKLHWLHKVLVSLCALTVCLGVVGLDLKWREEWAAVFLSLQATAPFLHIGAVIGTSALAWVLAGYYWRVKSRVLKPLLLAVYLALLCVLYISPLFISSPCILDPSHLPPKPQLIGHRGAPMLAPENTMMSFYKMVECGAGVFESDVMVSRDGVPFLMHDHTLLRTTDVGRVFPGRAGEDCSNFTWDQLQELDASDWFLQRNPFRTGVSLTLGQTQRVPALEELLRAADNRSISVMFDLRPPPAGHPHNESYINLTLRAILDSQIRPELVLWLPDERRDDVISQAPGFRQIYGRRRRENETLRNVNLSYKNLSASEIRSYRQDNISVNLYVVDRPWLFSHLWCAGATSVTTNACHLLQNMRRPLWVLAPTSYLVIWIVTDAVSLIHIIWAFLLQRKCCRRRETDGSEAVLLMKIQSLVL